MVETAAVLLPQEADARESMAGSPPEDEPTSKGGSPPQQKCGGNPESEAKLVAEGRHSKQAGQPGVKRQTDQKAKRVSPDSFMKVCELLCGRKVRFLRRSVEDKSVDDHEEVVEGVLRKAQGRNSVKVLTDSGDVVLIRTQEIISMEAPDGTCIVLAHDAPQPDADSKINVSGGYPNDAPTSKNVVAKREKNLLFGLKYEVEKAGPDGGRKAGSGAEVQVYYDGRLAKNGQRFDEGNLSFQLGTRAVIKGFDQGVEGMLVGERRKITIPWKLAYGAAGNPPKIPPKADLVFTVELNAVI